MNFKTILLSTLVLALTACDSDVFEGETIAKVGSESVTKDEFNNYLKFKRIPEQDKGRVDRMLEDYLQRKAISQQVTESKFIDAKLAEIEVEEFRKEMLIGRYFENYLKDKVNEEAVRNYYNSNPEQFNAQQVKVSHILIRTNKAMSEAERQALLSKAQEAHAKATSGKTFEEVVTAYSEDKVSAKKGGDLGWIKKGSIDPAFSTKVFAMKKGDISEPFATAFGYHIVKMTDGPQELKSSFEKVKGNIRFQLRQQAKQAEKERMLKAVEIKR